MDSFLGLKSIETSSTVGKRGNNVHNQSFLLKGVTMSNDKPAGYYDGGVNMTQALKSGWS